MTEFSYTLDNITTNYTTSGTLQANSVSSNCYVYYEPNKLSEALNRIEELEKKQLKEVKNMKNLYEVIVVSKDEEILGELKRHLVIAENEREAEFKADVALTLKSKSLTYDDVTIICNKIGEIKIKEKPQEVKIVKE